MKENKLTPEEIIKALECCIKPTRDCENCPYYKNDECFDMVKGDALNLIVRQQAEIERLSNKCESVFLSHDEEIGQAKKWARAEAIKEFADLVDRDVEEMLSDSIKEQNPHLYLIHQIVKDRLKEMVGEDK